MTEQSALFTGYEPPTPAAAEELSADRRRTLRQRADIAAGLNPVTRQRAVGDGRTCGNCVFRVLFDWHNRSYPKCTRYESRISHSAATDVRAWWPGCTDHELADGAA